MQPNNNSNNKTNYVHTPEQINDLNLPKYPPNQGNLNYQHNKINNQHHSDTLPQIYQNQVNGINIQEIYSQQYNKLINNQQDEKIEIDKYSLIALCTYIIPTLSIFILIFNFNSNKINMQRHARQALILQIIWLMVLYIINSTNLPILTGNGFSITTIWNLLYIIASIRAGSSAYLGNFYKIPLIYDIASNFIENKMK